MCIRDRLSAIRMVFATIGSNFTNLIAATLILFLSGTNHTANTARGYSLAVIVSVIIGLPTIIWSAVKSKERVPVSYTHLDVYKRQVLWCSGHQPATHGAGAV